MKAIVTTEYQANDGRLFKRMDSCVEHDKRLERGGIFLDVVGEITESHLNELLCEGYSLCNYRPGCLTIFAPQRYGGGSAGYIYGLLADQLGKEHDLHNFTVSQRRAREEEDAEKK